MADNTRLLPLRILQVLRQHTDADHTLSQKEIQTLLEQEYGMKTDRGAVRRCIHELMLADDVPIEGKEREYAYKSKTTKNKEAGTQYTGLCYRHDFDQSELHMLMDGVLFSRNIPANQRQDLLNRLSEQGGKYFHSYMAYMRGTMPDVPEIPQLFLNIEILDEAIRTKKQVRIEYGYLGIDYKLQPAWPTENCEPYWIILNPYRLAAIDGRYFLICNTDKYDNISIYRIDRFIRCELLDTPVKPQRNIEGWKSIPDTVEFVQSNAFMGFGESGTITFTIPKEKAYEAIDFFGKTVSFKINSKEPGQLNCSVYANHYSMKIWAMQNAGMVRVTSPASLVEEIMKSLENGLSIYKTSCHSIET